MGLNDILNTARNALTAQTFGLAVTGQNIANVNTPGFARRRALLETSQLGDQNLGGVQIGGLERVADNFVAQRHLSTTALASHAFTRDQLLASTETIVNDFSGGGFGDDVNALFSSFSRLASRPGDETARSSVLTQGQVLASRVRQAATHVSNQRTEIVEQARSLTEVINQELDSIAQLSGQINRAQASGQVPADLLDRRDAHLLELTELIEVKTFQDGNGQLVVQGPGVTLMQGESPRHVRVDLSSDGSLKVLAETSSGAGAEITPHLSGGSLAALVEVREADLTEVLGELDAFAFELSSSINAVHSAGVALDGSTGRNFFEVSPGAAGAAANLRLNADLQNNPNLLAASADAASLPGGGTVAGQLAQLADQRITGGATRTPSEGYAHLVGAVGQLKAGSAHTLETRKAMNAQVEVTRQSISGVSLDEEMVSLTKYQRAFEASTRVLNVADQLLQELLTTVGR